MDIMAGLYIFSGAYILGKGSTMCINALLVRAST